LAILSEYSVLIPLFLFLEQHKGQGNYEEKGKVVNFQLIKYALLLALIYLQKKISRFSCSLYDTVFGVLPFYVREARCKKV